MVSQQQKPIKYIAIRQGKNQPRLYLGSGPIAEYWLEVHCAEHARWNRECAFQRQWHQLERAFGVFERDFRSVWEASLIICGFHRHDRGVWRRRGRPLHQDHPADTAELATGSLRKILCRAHLGSQGCHDHLIRFLTGGEYYAVLGLQREICVQAFSALVQAHQLGLWPFSSRSLDHRVDSPVASHEAWLLSQLSFRQEFAQAAVLGLVAAMKSNRNSSPWFAKRLLTRAQAWRAREARYARATVESARLFQVVMQSNECE